MSNYRCNNKDCSKFGVIEEYYSDKFKMVDGRLQSVNAPCPCCGEIREEINPNADIPLSEKNIGIGMYTSASPEQRKEILKKRSHEHFEKEVKPFKEHQLHETVRQFKEASKN